MCMLFRAISLCSAVLLSIVNNDLLVYYLNSQSLEILKQGQEIKILQSIPNKQYFFSTIMAIEYLSN